MRKKLVSYIFPIYNEEDNIPVLYDALEALLSENLQYRYELIFINDGSKDTSLELLVALQEQDPRVSVIDFSRNFGHQIAITAGLDASHGDAVIIMDSDLQDPPEVSLLLLQKWEEGYEVVYAQRRTRDDTPLKKLTAYWFYGILQKLADIEIPRDTGDFRLMDRKVVDALNCFKEHSRFMRGLVSYVGFSQIGVQFDRHKRNAGTSGYPLKKMLRFAADGIFGFSTAPLQFITRIGFGFSLLSFLGILYCIYLKLFVPQDAVQGWAFIVICILLIGGIQIITLGILGSYIGRIYIESQNRPLYIVRQLYEHKD
jgi:glycosyltransferase involved in cell wall biosynthesis